MKAMKRIRKWIQAGEEAKERRECVISQGIYYLGYSMRIELFTRVEKLTYTVTEFCNTLKGSKAFKAAVKRALIRWKNQEFDSGVKPPTPEEPSSESSESQKE